MFIRWKVRFAHKAAKQAENLDKKVLLVLQVLIDNLIIKGPFPGVHWHNYGKLYTKKGLDKRHCHLIKRNPTYICCWQVYKFEKLIEIYYVGTHEKAPY